MTKNKSGNVRNGYSYWDERQKMRRNNRTKRFLVKLCALVFGCFLCLLSQSFRSSTSSINSESRRSAMMRKSGVFNTNNEDEDNNTYKQWRRLLGKANTLKTNQRPGLEEVSMNAEEEQKRIDYCTGWRINEQEDKCRYITKYECNQETDSVVTNYLHFHHCTMQGHSAVSVAMLVMVVALSFYVLGDTAEEFFCPVVRRVAWWLRLSPNTAGVTLLALGNGAPDVFASLAAFSSGDGGSGEIGAGMIGAIVSAGTFVSGGVVGAVAVVAAPFEVPKVAFLRDAWFYFFGAVLVCYVVTSGEVYPMHAIGFILYYVSFVCLVIFSDIRERKRRERLNISPSVVDEELLDIHTDASSSSHEQIEVDWYDEPPVHEVLGQNIIGWCQTNGKTRYMLFKALVHAPLDICRRMTIPSAEPERWNRFYALSSVSLGPLLLLHQLKDIVDAKMLIGNDFVGFLPLWMCVLIPSTLIGCAVFVASNHSHQPEFWPIALALAFGTSIVWISLAATELLECLTVLGHISGISPAVLGVTVLAWGNSVGDLVADVVIAKGGQPTMAVAACYSGPMFNMCVGLGLAFALQAIELSPAPLTLLTHANIPISFMFLFASLLLSLTYVPAKKFRITKPFGVTLILMYALSNVIMITLEIGQHV